MLRIERDEKTDEEVVRYESLDNPGHEHPPRLVEEFLEEVDRPDFNYRGPRFSFVRVTS